MAKKAKFGLVTKPKRDKPKKRPARHKKNRNNTRKEWVNTVEKVEKENNLF